MITFENLVSKLGIKDKYLYDPNIVIKNIVLDEHSLQLHIYIDYVNEIPDDSIINFENKIRLVLDGLDLYFYYEKKEVEYKDEYELIKKEIIKYNPSATAWIENLNIFIDFDKSIIEITVPNESLYYSLTNNGLKSTLLDKLKVFKEYNIKFKNNSSELSENNIEDYTTKVAEEEKKISKNTVTFRENTAKPSKESTNNNSEKYSFGKKDIGDFFRIKDLNINLPKVTCKADVFAMEVRELKNQKYLVIMSITDYTSSYIAKVFLSEDKYKEFLENVKVGSTIIVTGSIQFDSYNKAENLMCKYIELSEKHIREEEYSGQKRVELRVHTKMSSMNGVTAFDDFAKRASYWGMNALAITDIADAQGFPEAMSSAKKHDLKIIYGLDANFIDDTNRIIKNYTNSSIDTNYVVFDIETTGFSPRRDKITEIGAVKVCNGVITDRFSKLINPEIPIPERVVEITGISNALVENEPTIDSVIFEFNDFCKDCILVAHNASFDISFIRREMKSHGIDFQYSYLDTLQLARSIIKDIKRYNLTALSKKLGVSLVNAHRAVNDAEATAEIFIKMLDILKKQGIEDFDGINSLISEIDVSALFEDSCSLIVKNQIGLKNLYKLISASHMKYVNRVAKVPKTLIDRYREGILVGSGNNTSPLYKAVFNMEPEEEIEKIASYYDYIEIQPVSNNLNYIVNGMVENEDTLREVNRELYNVGKKLNIPVVATGDVFYLDDKDDIIRRIILNGKTGRPDENAHIPQKLYFRTTQEMLDEFYYLGEDVAEEVVIKNTNYIADLCDSIKPIPDGTFPPVIEGSEKDLKEMCYKKAHEIYGDTLPEIVEKRLERELDSIITHGYAVLYIIAQKLVKKSNDDGYLVGSRGSVGSSFAATMSSITEVNPLPPHYVCPNCKHSEFFDDATIGSGVDLPDKVCPVCGTQYRKDGHNIPFEVFLGFNGDKEPDIDLNFAGEYQPVAHKYTEELFGKGYVFRAGTIGTVAEKTAYGYVKKYYEDEYIPNVEVDRLSKEAMGVKRTSGQHPGGVIICPRDKEIYDFTPIQHPADDMNSDVVTTHFDYNFIHEKLLKLDILGHDGPTIIKMLEDLTGFNSTEIALDDADTISLFSSSEKLNMNEDIFSTSTGTLGIPEFGTNFVKQMLLETTPKTFADLVRISGLSHGTDVWTNNAQLLVDAGEAKLSDVICTREDIMLYLIQAGAENKMAFDTMEKVRKGKGLTDEQKEIMKTLPLPSWYIDSCEKIKYMFPKAHAVAYVMLSFRTAYYKLNYPLAFYATYFTIKLQDFDGELIMSGVDAIKQKVDALKNNKEDVTAKDKGMLTVLEVVLEMLSRGYEFANADIYESHSSKFDVKSGKVLLPLRAFSGVGEQIADNIVAERVNGKFISIEDMSKRAKVTKSVIEILTKNKVLNDLPESNQLSLFNLLQ